MRSNLHPKVLRDIYDLIIWYGNHIEKFPRNRRIVFGDRIMNLLMEIQSGLLKAYYGKNKIDLLYEANLILEELRILTRMITDLKCINYKQQEYAVKGLNEIGKQIGGWIKSEKE